MGIKKRGRGAQGGGEKSFRFVGEKKVRAKEGGNKSNYLRVGGILLNYFFSQNDLNKVKIFQKFLIDILAIHKSRLRVIELPFILDLAAWAIIKSFFPKKKISNESFLTFH